MKSDAAMMLESGEAVAVVTDGELALAVAGERSWEVRSAILRLRLPGKGGLS